METATAACHTLFAMALMLVSVGLLVAIEFFTSDVWDSRPQWQREADYLSQFVPRGRL